MLLHELMPTILNSTIACYIHSEYVRLMTNLRGTKRAIESSFGAVRENANYKNNRSVFKFYYININLRQHILFHPKNCTIPLFCYCICYNLNTHGMQLFSLAEIIQFIKLICMIQSVN